MSAKDNKNPQDENKVETTGHSWDGIEELNNPLPRWWLWFFYATIAFGIVWTILYPAWPLVNGATRGILGYNSRVVVEEQLEQVKQQNAAIDERLVSSSYEAILADGELNNYATNGGGAVFQTYCIQCHGAGGAGNPGYPNLLDDDWLWGGTFEDIDFSIRHGIRDEADPETRFSQMTPFKDVLDGEQIDALVYYVQDFSQDVEHEYNKQEAATLFAENCASCHGENAMGMRDQGAPNLTDSIWLYGGDFDTVHTTIMEGRANVMPHWGERLTPSQIKQVVTYVHGLGGGE